MRSQICFIVTFLAILLLAAPLAIGNDDLLEQVKKGFDDAGERIQRSTVRARYRAVGVKGGREILQTEVVSMFEGKLFSLAVTDPETGDETVHVANDKYAFVATKQKNQKRYALKDYISRQDSRPERMKAVSSGIGAIQMTLFYPYRVAGAVPVWIFVRDPGITILRAEHLDVEGKPLIRVDYEGSLTGVASNTRGTIAGYLICDPKSNWALTEQFIKSKPTDQQGSWRIQYSQPGVEGANIQSKLFAQLIDEANIENTRRRLQLGSAKFPRPLYELLEQMEPPTKDQFYLSCYGLPEPKPSSFWTKSWVVLLIMLLLFAIAGLFYWRRSR